MTHVSRGNRTGDSGLAAAVGNGAQALLRMQHADGCWSGELSSNPTIDAGEVFLRTLLAHASSSGAHTPVLVGVAQRIRHDQLPDGGWATFYGGPSDLHASVESYLALRLAGDAQEADHMRAAAGRVRALGGLENSRALTRIWLALFGIVPWRETPALPPEMIWLRPWMPFDIYDLALWARLTVVPLTVVSALQPVVPQPGIRLEELRSGAPAPASRGIGPGRGGFALLDAALRGYGRIRPAWVKRRAIARIASWLLERQEEDGWWAGIQTTTVYSLLALHLAGYPADHPRMRAGLDCLGRYTRDAGDGSGRRSLVALSSVWDTSLSLVSLIEAGLCPSDPALAHGADWLLDRQAVRRGDWARRRPGLTPGGWGFQSSNQLAPDADDTAEVIRALSKITPTTSEAALRRDSAVRRGIDWVIGMECEGGGWGAYDADNTSAWIRRLPISDYGEVTDPPSADVTAHVVEMLCEHGMREHPAVRRGVRWLLHEQAPDGSWWGRWGSNYLYGTGHVLPSLAAAGIPGNHHAMARAARWLLGHQNPDGGWGEDQRSYPDPQLWAGRGTSTPSQTAWALIGLTAAAEPAADAASLAAIESGIAWLIQQQLPDGTWEEPQYTGTGFPWDFPMRYDLYRQVFPVSALARCLRTFPGLDTAP